MGEPFTRADGVTFAFIWFGLAIYTADALWAQRRTRRSRLTTAVATGDGD